MGTFRFTKAERLTRKKVIESLFAEGRSFSAYPLKVVFQPGTERQNQVLISVPVRAFPKAVDRNTLKRRIREGYRLNKAMLAASTRYSLAYIYIAKEILPSTAIHEAIQTSLRRLSQHETKA